MYHNHPSPNTEQNVDRNKRDEQIPKEVKDKLGEGNAYYKLGIDYYDLGDFKTAIEYYELCIKIAKEVGNKAGEGASYCNLGSCYHGLGDFKTAIECYELSLKIAKEVGDKVVEGNSYCNLGVAYHDLGDFKTAIEYNELSLKIAKEVGHKVMEGNSSCNLGNAYRRLGDFQTAIEYYELSLKIAKEVGTKAGDLERTSYCNLGAAYRRLGDFKTAIEYNKFSLKIAKEVGDKDAEGTSYCNLGNAYSGLGDFKTAIEYYELSLKIAKEVGDKAAEGKSYCNLGNAYCRLRYFKKAIENLDLSLNIGKEVGNKAVEGNSYCNLGVAYHDLGDFNKAIKYYEVSLKIAKEIGDKAGEENNYCNLGSAYHGLRDFNRAVEYHEFSLNIAKEVGAKNGVARSFYNLGVSCESQGSFLKALDYYHSSVISYNALRAGLQCKDQWKMSYRDTYGAVYSNLWGLYLKLGQDVEALLVAEQGRAQALNDLVNSKYGSGEVFYRSHLPLDKSSCELLMSCVASNTVFIAVDRREIYLWVVSMGKDVQPEVKIINIGDYDSISATTVDFIESLNKKILKEIRRALVKCENRSLDPDPCDETLANERSADCPSEKSPNISSALRTLYDVIIAPIADLINGNELVLVPESSLFLVPYAALINSQSKYLCESFRSRVIPSLTTLKLIVDCPEDFHSKTGALLVGDPCLDEVLFEGRKLDKLPCAREEVEMIGKILDTAPLTGEKATKDEVLNRLSSVALVHIAAHGRMDTGEIALAPQTTRTSQTPAEKDFMLTMKDVLDVQMRARLVVLSCCHSARGEIKDEGVVGIARAFLGAGARSVLVALWALDDDATLEFMKHFYEELVKGKRASEALNQARRCMRESGWKVRHWAPFVLIGDDVTLELPLC